MFCCGRKLFLLSEMLEWLKSMESCLPQVESKLNDQLGVVEALLLTFFQSMESNFKFVIEKLGGLKPKIDETLSNVPLSMENEFCLLQTVYLLHTLIG